VKVLAGPKQRLFSPKWGGAWGINILMLAAISGLWSTGYILILIADESLPPITLTAIRAALAAVVLLALCLALRRPLWRNGFFHRAYLAPTFLLATFPWALTAEGEHFVDAGLTSLMTSLTPISTFLIVTLVLREQRMAWPRLLGMALSLFGLALAIGWQGLASGRVEFAGLALVGAAFSMYGVNGILLARWGQGVDPLVSSFFATAYASALLAGAACLIERPWSLDPSRASLTALTVLGCVVTAGGYALYFTLVKRAGSMFASTWGYLVPALGVVVSAVWLHTPLGWTRLAGAALVVAGVILVNRRATASASGARSESPEG